MKQKRNYLLKVKFGRVRIYLYKVLRGWRRVEVCGRTIYHLGYVSVLVEDSQ